MMFFQKKDKVSYKFMQDVLNENPKEHIDKFLTKTYPNDSIWYKSLPTYFTSTARNFKDHWKYYIKQLENKKINSIDVEQEFFQHTHDTDESRTAKRCAGILSLFKKSYTVKFPCELFVEIKDHQIRSIHVPNKKLIHVVSHDDGSFKPQNPSANIFQNKKSLKIVLPVYISTEIPYVFLNPSYHNTLPFDVLPASIDNEYTKIQDLTVHTLVDVSEDRDIMINEGDALAYMWFAENTKLKFNEKLVDTRMRTKFNSPARSF